MNRETERSTFRLREDTPLLIRWHGKLYEKTTLRTIRKMYDLSLREYLYLLSVKGKRAIESRRKEVLAGIAKPFVLPEHFSNKEMNLMSRISYHMDPEYVMQVMRERQREERDASASLSLGGMRSSGIRSKDHFVSTPVDDELTQEDRRKAWAPPEKDTSRFSGKSGARHKAYASYKGLPDNPSTNHLGRSSHGLEELPPSKKQLQRSRKLKGQGSASSTAQQHPSKPAKQPQNNATKQTAIRVGSKDNIGSRRPQPLHDSEIAILDACYRLHGASPNWPGWKHLLPGRSKDFLLSEAKRLRLYEPDNELWTPEEIEVFNSRKASIPASSKEWRYLLPRKSHVAIRAAYAGKIQTRKVTPDDNVQDARPWSHAEDSRIKDLYFKGLTLGSELEPHMNGRQADEIEQRIRELGLASGAPSSAKPSTGKKRRERTHRSKKSR